MGVMGWAVKGMGSSGAAFAALARNLELRQHAAPARVLRGSGLASQAPAPGIDVHLVMNTFNRLAGMPQLEDSEHSEQIFDLCDYLRQALMHLAPVEVTLAQELELLATYQRLLARFRGWTMEAPVQVLGDAGEIRLRAHSLCLIAQALACGHGTDSPGAWRMALRVGGSRRAGTAIEMSLQALSPRRRARLQRIDEEMQALCDTLPGPGERWQFSGARASGGATVLAVHIHRAPLARPQAC